MREIEGVPVTGVPTILEVAAGDLRVGDQVEEGREIFRVIPCCGSVEVHIGTPVPGRLVPGMTHDYERSWKDPTVRHYRYIETVRVARLAEPPREVEV